MLSTTLYTIVPPLYAPHEIIPLFVDVHVCMSLKMGLMLPQGTALP